MTNISSKSIQTDWENKLAQWQSSGKSGATWCRDERINYSGLNLIFYNFSDI